MEIKGTITAILPLQSGQGKKGEWKKQEYVLETEGQYPKRICLGVWGDKIAQFQLRVGDVVAAHIEIESREYNGKYYTEVRCWKLEKHSSGPVVAPLPSSGPAYDDPFNTPTPRTGMASNKPVDTTDDLPFRYRPHVRQY